LLGAVTLLVGMLGLAVAFRAKKPYVSVGILWFFVTLVPVIGIVQVGSMARADRYVYLPAVGLFVAVAWAVADAVRTRPAGRKVAAVVAAVLVAAYAARAHVAVGPWRDSETLFRHAIAVTGPNPVACTNLGYALLARNDLDGAQAQFDAALRIKPGYVHAIINLGIVHGMRGNLVAAIQYLDRAIALQPDNADAHLNLANALLMTGQTDKAVEHYATTLRLAPNDAEAHYRLGLLLATQGHTEEGTAHLRQALRLRPDFQDAAAALRTLDTGAP